METVARTVGEKVDRDEPKNSLNHLYMLSLEVDVKKLHMHIGFCDTTNSAVRNTISSWPTTFSQQFPELIRVLRNRGAFIRYCTYRPESREVENCAMLLKKTWNDRSIMQATYMGKPVKVSILIRLSEVPTIRMKTVFDEAVPGVTISNIGTMKEEKCQMIWNGPSLVGKTYAICQIHASRKFSKKSKTNTIIKSFCKLENRSTAHCRVMGGAPAGNIHSFGLG